MATNDNFTKIPNDLIEVLTSRALNDSGRRILLHIARKTFGFHKEQDSISLTQFQNKLCLGRKAVVASLKRLQLVSLVILIKKGNSKKHPNIYTIDTTDYQDKLVALAKLISFESKKLVQDQPQLGATQKKVLQKKYTRSADRDKKAFKEKDSTFRDTSKSLLSYLFEKTGVKQILVPKQMAAIKRILNAGYSEDDTRWAIDKLYADPYWRERGFDFMTVAGQLPKLKMRKPKTLEEQGYKHFKSRGGNK